MTEKPRIRVPSRTADSYQNFMTQVGIGAGNMLSGSQYGFNPISRNRVHLEQMYRGSWIVGRAIDVPAEDMTREGIEIKGVVEPDAIELMNAEMRRLGIMKAFTNAERWSRLYGGAIAVVLIDGQKPSDPLRIETVASGAFRGLMVVDRWRVTPSLAELVEDLGPHLGMPKFYDALLGCPAYAGQRIHYSRVIRLDGNPLPYWQQLAENGWGMSVVERIFDRLVAFDSTTAGTAQLVDRAYLRTMKVENLRDILSSGDEVIKGLVKQVEMIRAMQRNEGLTLIDATDDLTFNNYTFSGLDSVLLQMGQQLCGALEIPMVRMFGQSPAGLNSTGDSDLKTYYDGVRTKQEDRLRPGAEMVANLTYRSLFNKEPPKGFGIEFVSLWQMSDTEKAAVAVSTTSAVTTAYEAQIISAKTALKELRQSAERTGIFSNITDEEIEAADDEPPKPMPVPQTDPADEGPDKSGPPGLVEGKES